MYVLIYYAPIITSFAYFEDKLIDVIYREILFDLFSKTNNAHILLKLCYTDSYIA